MGETNLVVDGSPTFGTREGDRIFPNSNNRRNCELDEDEKVSGIEGHRGTTVDDN